MSYYQLRLVSPSSAEFDELEKMVSETCPNECLISIEEVSNMELEKKYQDRRDELARIGEVREARVFHGSRNFSAIHSILKDGFRASFNTVSAFGKGTYFATAYGYSKNYSSLIRGEEYKVMLICDISYQKPVRGRSNQSLDPNEGDCWVDSTTNPTIFSVPNDDQSIPRYVVRFF